MNIFIDERQRRSSGGTCYFEFQRGLYRNKCWLSDSINIDANLWDEYRLSELFSQVISEFDYYGVMTVSPRQWDKIAAIGQASGDPWKAVIEDAAPWVENCFRTHDVFTIVGM